MKRIRGFRKGEDNPAWKGGVSKHYCIDCGKRLKGYYAKKCSDCANKDPIKNLKHSKRMKDENNPNWKGGFPHCIDCGKELKTWNSKRCKKCYLIWAKVRENNSNYKGGITHPHCIDCGKEIYHGFTRCQSCANKRENNPNWQGGKSFEPYTYEFNRELKEQIKKRDNHICQFPNCSENEYLVPHHINYIKKDCRPDNLITLCRSCNTVVNSHRQDWQIYFESLMMIRAKIEAFRGGVKLTCKQLGLFRQRQE